MESNKVRDDSSLEWNRAACFVARFLVLTLLAMCFSACSEQQKRSDSTPESSESDVQPTFEAVSYFTLSDSADFEADFRQAIAAGDERFVGVMTYALVVPGVPDYYQQFEQGHGVKVVEGTSDHTKDEAALAHQLFAEKYAESYNKLLLEHLAGGSED